MLRCWEETIDIIRQKPSGEYECEYKDHSFVVKAYLICHYLKISEGAFNIWVEIVRHGFIKRDLILMKKSDYEEIGLNNDSMIGGCSWKLSS